MTFFFKTEQGYSFKLLIDLLQNTIRYPCFNVSSKGLELLMLDHYQRLLVNVELPASNFIEFNCDKPIVFGITSTYMQKLIKAVKRRNFLSLQVTEDRPSDLKITVVPKDKTSVREYAVKIQHVQMIDVDIPTGYDSPIHILCSDYQQMCKEIGGMDAQVVEMHVTGKQIQFECNAEDIYSKKFRFGVDLDTNKNASHGFKMTFDINQLVRLGKLSGIGGTSSYMKIFAVEGYPLLFQVNVGTLGTLSIYMKSNEEMERMKMIQDEIL